MGCMQQHGMGWGLCRRDRRTYINQVATDAEEAASNGHLNKLYRTTRIRNRRRTYQRMPIRSKEGDILAKAMNNPHAERNTLEREEKIPDEWKKGILIKLPNKEPSEINVDVRSACCVHLIGNSFPPSVYCEELWLKQHQMVVPLK
ncbi:hypothetical protein ACROYT_G022100 [Oculina patagonica]